MKVIKQIKKFTASQHFLTKCSLQHSNENNLSRSRNVIFSLGCDIFSHLFAILIFALKSGSQFAFLGEKHHLKGCVDKSLN